MNFPHWRFPLLSIAIAAGVVLLDQVTKLLVVTGLPRGRSIDVVGDFVRLTHVQNSGGAFGLLRDRGVPFSLLSLIAVAVILIIAARMAARQGGIRIALGLLLGGAAGNLIDRFRLETVVDFVDIGIGGLRWPVFNVADMSVVSGVLLFLILTGRPDSAAGALPDQG